MKIAVEKLSRFFSCLFAAGSGLAMFGVFLIIFVNSARRYTVGKSFEWGEELPVYLAIYGIMFGMSWAYLQNRHVRFNILLNFIPTNLSQKLHILVDVLMVGTGILLAYSGYLFAAKRGGIDSSGLINMARQLSTSTGWDELVVFGQMFPYQLAIAVGGVMFTIAALLRVLQRLLGICDVDRQEC